MSRRSATGVLIVLVALVLGCRRNVVRLDDVQKMAYEVKPAVVRVSAYATAEFRCPNAVLESIADVALLPLSRELTGTEQVADTGAGGSGSGFIIHPEGLILTSGHVVAPTRDGAALAKDLRRNGAIALLVKQFPIETLRGLQRGEDLDRYIGEVADAGRLQNLRVFNSVELSNGETLPFRTVRYSPALNERGMDLALLRIKDSNLPVLRLGDSDGVRVGDAVWSIGYPAVASSTDDVIGGWLSSESDLEPTFSNGTITAIKRNAINTPVLQSNVAIYRGNSGGPAVNRDGEVVAISTWGHRDAEQIKFLVPINVAKNMLAEAGVKADVDGDFNRNYRAALDAAYVGRWTDAREALDTASRLFPRSPDVIRFRNDVDRAVRALPLWVLHPVASGTAVLVLVVILGTLLVQLRGRVPRATLVGATLPATAAATMVAPVMRDQPAAADEQMLGVFTVLNGARAGEKLGLGGSGIRIGRESTFCEIVLENPKVSRLHAEVVSIDGKVLLIDRNSSNGTFVNDEKIDKRYLRDGDIIYFGGRNAIAVAFHS